MLATLIITPSTFPIEGQKNMLRARENHLGKFPPFFFFRRKFLFILKMDVAWNFCMALTIIKLFSPTSLYLQKHNFFFRWVSLCLEILIRVFRWIFFFSLLWTIITIIPKIFFFFTCNWNRWVPYTLVNILACCDIPWDIWGRK